MACDAGRRSRRVATPGLLALVTAVAVAACASSHLSAPQLRNRANRICIAAAARTSRLSTPHLTGAGTFLADGLRQLRPELARLRALRPPSSAGNAYQAAVDTFAAEVDAIAVARTELQHGADATAAYRRLQQRLVPLEAKAGQAWRELGITGCLTT